MSSWKEASVWWWLKRRRRRRRRRHKGVAIRWSSEKEKQGDAPNEELQGTCIRKHAVPHYMVVRAVKVVASVVVVESSLV
jgi:hypothetical protein